MDFEVAARLENDTKSFLTESLSSMAKWLKVTFLNYNSRKPWKLFGIIDPVEAKNDLMLKSLKLTDLGEAIEQLSEKFSTIFSISVGTNESFLTSSENLNVYVYSAYPGSIKGANFTELDSDLMLEPPIQN